MNNLLDVPIAAVTALTPERAVVVMRAILRSECGYAKLRPTVLTISSRLTIADGGIDAEVNVPPGPTIPTDCIFQTGLTGFQIKSGTSFKPWTPSSIRGELLDSRGKLYSEVERLIRRGGRYTLLCTGHDMTPEQRNDSRQQIAVVLAEVGFGGYEELIEVLGASQVSDFSERYPGTASLLAVDPIQEAWILEEWQRDAHMANVFEASPEQSQMIARIRAGLQGETKHIRVLGEPGLGKTRIVLESVKDENIAPYVLYIQHGSQFGQTRLFRQLLKTGYDKPLVLIIDELPESELSEIWKHLKPRCGSLKIVSLDHGRDETHDEEIERLHAPSLSDETIKKILVSRVGESRELDRWVAICEGSPRVAQAVADNLRANPDDILKPPSTVPIWARFIHGYSSRDESSARQIDCVTQHMALFSRFGYETPVGDEAAYIAKLIQKVDPTIGWARFQEIVQGLRAKKVLQGSRTLFFVPKALHIYLWKQFWERYGRGFDFTQTFKDMPESLHAWFMNMFKFAGDATAHVIDDILRPDGFFSERAALTSAKGSRFLSILAEANPAVVLRLLEATIGKWTDQELLDLKQDRQSLVWALEKIAVWPTLTVRAIQVLVRFATNENANFSNNSTGTLIGLFRIGPEAAATESTPEARLPAMLRLLRASGDEERRLGLKAMDAALDSRGMGFRIVGAEYQGLKERAKLWIPATYGDLWQAKLIYFQALVDETQTWPPSLRAEVCQALLEAVEQQIRTPPCTELAFQVLSVLVDDSTMPPEKLNRFFWHWQKYEDDGQHPEIVKRLQSFERRYTRRDLASRFQCYVIDVDWMEWDEDFRERHNKPKNRAKILVNALARRIAQHPERLSQIQHLLSPAKNAPTLWHFGEQIALNDATRAFLQPLTRLTLETKHHVCLHGYLSAVRASDPEFYLSTVRGFMGVQSTAWLGATIALRTDYDDELFAQCLDAQEKKWIDPLLFTVLRFGRAIESVPPERTGRLLRQLSEDDAQDSLVLLVELLDSIPFNDSSPFNSGFVFDVVSKSVPDEENRDAMRGYYWKNVCSKLIKWDASRTLPLLDALLTEMGKAYRLSYDSNVVPLANELVLADPAGAWDIVEMHFEESLPKWRDDLFQWLKGGLSGFDEEDPRGAIADLPVPEILEWIEEDPEHRAGLMAHAAPRTLDDEHGGRLTRELLYRYGQFDGVRSGISATFHSGGWTGPTSAYLKRKREKFRRWLAGGFEIEITQWIEAEIECLDRNIEREEIDEERSRFD
ncbi:hypothetical protein PG1C_05585 [Rugosibacter aromaticivorans]|uniref:Uncharacterized protein n=1 Tax=Rugosibacter aromaticivorans TaxID=1565605 RepID=A0A0C5IZ87_9PROT|nr:ATP-binding protein [Rugosibacter aromaticivorans]AJP48077.1 hypothetical protein PG1C_05585 [Rugosibacter aromaticivorans]